MTTEQIVKILSAHGVPYYIRGGRVYADSMISGTERFEIVEDCTGWSRKRLLSWLGY